MKYKACVAVMLCIALLLSGCTPEQEESSPLPAGQPQSNIPVELPDPNVPAITLPLQEYKRPNIPKTLEMVTQSTRRVVEAADYEEALSCYVRASQLLEEMEKMRLLAEARYALDTNSRTYRVEQSYWNSHAMDLRGAAAALERAVQSSVHGKGIVQSLSLRQQQVGAETLSQGYESRDNALELETLRTEQQLLYLEQKESRYHKALSAFLTGEEYAPDSALVAQVETLRTVAKLEGQNSRALGFAQELERRYSQSACTLTAAETLHTHLEELFLPLSCPPSTGGEILYTKKKEELEERLYQLAETLSPSFQAMLSDCNQGETLRKKQKERSLALTQPLYLTSLHLPLLAPALEAERLSVNRFGGFLAQGVRCYTQNSPPLSHDEWLSYACEYGGGVVFQRFYDLLFPQGAVEARQASKQERLRELLLQGMIMELEEMVYGEKLPTVEEFLSRFDQLYAKYFPTGEGKEAALTVAVYRLMLEGNSSDRVLGLLVAMQLEQIDLQDPAQSRKRLETLFTAEGAEPIKETLERLTLGNPFRFADMQMLTYGYTAPPAVAKPPQTTDFVEDAKPSPQSKR